MTHDNTQANARRPSVSSSSSRSASFSLPDRAHPVRPGESSHAYDVQTIPEALGATYANTSGNAASSVSGGSEVFADSDEEKMDEETRAHKRDFEKKRAMHYGQEAALALKKSREMEDEDEDEETDDSAPPSVPAVPNGVNGSRQ